MQQYDAALARYGASLAGLQAVPASLAGKENSVEQDSRALLAAGVALEESCRQLEGLRQQKAAGTVAQRPGSAGGGGPKDGGCCRLPHGPGRCAVQPQRFLVC